MLTLAALIALELDTLALPALIEASTSARLYIAEYKQHLFDVPAWLLLLQKDLVEQLADERRETEVTKVAEAKQRVRGRMPPAERQAAILAEIAALQAELGP